MSAPGWVKDKPAPIPIVHRLKCWAENFDALLLGGKCCEVREEGPDRIFKAGEALELTRTGHDGKPTQPETRVIVEITHVDRVCGPFALFGADVAESSLDVGRLKPIAVLSLARTAQKITAPGAT